MVKRLKSQPGLYVWIPRIGFLFKPMTTESWDYWQLTPLMWFLLEKQTCSLPSFLKCYTLTGSQSTIHGGTGFLDHGLLCFVPAVKEHFRGSIGLHKSTKLCYCWASAELLYEKQRDWNSYPRSPHQQFSSTTSENTHYMNTLETRTFIGYKRKRRSLQAGRMVWEEIWKLALSKNHSLFPLSEKSFLEEAQKCRQK